MTTHLDTTSLDARVLRALFELARLNCPASVGMLASCLAVRPTQVALALVALEQRGFAHAGRARLTLPGLATAARLPALELVAPPRGAVVRALPRGLAKALPQRTGLRHAAVLPRAACH